MAVAPFLFGGGFLWLKSVVVNARFNSTKLSRQSQLTWLMFVGIPSKSLCDFYWVIPLYNPSHPYLESNNLVMYSVWHDSKLLTVISGNNAGLLGMWQNVISHFTN